MTEAATLARVFEKLIAHFGHERYDEEMRAARDVYCERRGRVFEDDDQWEVFVQGFLEWYIVERPWGNTGCAPCALAQKKVSVQPHRKSARKPLIRQGRARTGAQCTLVHEHRKRSDNAVLSTDRGPWVVGPREQLQKKEAADARDLDLGALRAWSNSQRCLALVQSIARTEMEIVDLIGGATFRITEERGFLGSNAGDIVELRLLGLGDRVYLGKTFVVHPPGTLRPIQTIVAAMRKDKKTRGDIIDHLALVRSRSRDYQHIAPSRMYERSSSHEVQDSRFQGGRNGVDG